MYSLCQHVARGGLFYRVESDHDCSGGRLSSSIDEAQSMEAGQRKVYVSVKQQFDGLM